MLALQELALLKGIDPELATSPLSADLESARASVVGWIALLTVVASAGTVAWLAAARGRLEALLGARVDPRRPGQPGRWSRWHWRALVAPAAPDRQEWWAVEKIGTSAPLAAAVAVAFAVGAPLAATGTVLSLAAPSADIIRSGLVVAAFGSGLLAVSAALAAPLVQAVRRREAIALRNVVTETVHATRWLPALPVLVALGCVMFTGLQFVEPPVRASCFVFGFECLELVVPADRATGNPRGPSVTVRFAIHRSPAADPRLLVVAVGGPGASGLAEAEWRFEGFDDRLRREFDIVFFDQRGTGESGGVDCEAAAAAWGGAPAEDPGAARIFVADCLREASVRGEDLARYRTAQVVDDIDALRRHLGHDRLVVYGESYGTYVAQAYAAAHPDRVEALVLDGPMDAALPAHEFWRLAAEGFDHSLQATLVACAGDAGCRADLPDPAGTYKQVLSRLRQGPVTIPLPVPDGDPIDVRITTTSLERGLGAMLYTETGRMVVQRVLAEVARGEWQPLARMAAGGGGVYEDPTFSEFVYFAVLCGDSRYSPTSANDDAAAFIERARESAPADGGFASVSLVGLPCLYWPAQPTTDPPRPSLDTAPFPVLVLTATADPITPAASGRRIAARIPNAWVVETTGGPHVTFGNGSDCPDDRVVAFLVDGTTPPSDVARCVGVVADPFLPLTDLDASDYADALEAMTAMDSELYAAPELMFWRGFEPLEFGCRFGGHVRIAAQIADYGITLDECEFARGLPIDATGTIDPESGELDVTVRVPRGELTYRYERGSPVVDGTWKGEQVHQRG